MEGTERKVRKEKEGTERKVRKQREGTDSILVYNVSNVSFFPVYYSEWYKYIRNVILTIYTRKILS